MMARICLWTNKKPYLAIIPSWSTVHEFGHSITHARYTSDSISKTKR